MTTAIDKTTAHDEVQRVRKHLQISIDRLMVLELDEDMSEWLGCIENCHEYLGESIGEPAGSM